jgi:Arc/MetJ family transcription regulator
LPPVVIERCLGVDTTKDNVCFRSKVRWKIKKIKEEVKLRDTASSGQKDRKQTI